MVEVWWHPEAEEEFGEAGFYYEGWQAGLGNRFGQSVLAAIGEAAIDPGRYRRVGSGCRKIRVHTFPYSVIYRLRENRIEIVAVMHGARRPGYWRERKSGQS